MSVNAVMVMVIRCYRVLAHQEGSALIPDPEYLVPRHVSHEYLVSGSHQTNEYQHTVRRVSTS